MVSKRSLGDPPEVLTVTDSVNETVTVTVSEGKVKNLVKKKFISFQASAHVLQC